MLDSEPFAVLAPYKNGSITLPKKCDIQRICERTTNSYITALLKDKKVKTEYKIDKLMEGYTKNRRLVHSNFGYIQLQRDILKTYSDWKVNLSLGASKLCV